MSTNASTGEERLENSTLTGAKVHPSNASILGAGIKLTVFLTLLANVFAPWGIATTLTPAALAVGLAVYLIKIAGLAAVIGTIECMFAKLRLFRVTDLLGAAFILALLGLLFFYILGG